MNVRSARRAAEFSKIEGWDTRGRVQSVRVPGHNGASYVVFIARDNHGLKVGCLKDDGSTCPGNSNGHICYHSLAALIVAADDQNQTLAFCGSEQDAENLARLGGEVYKVTTAHHSGGEAWVVAQSTSKAEPKSEPVAEPALNFPKPDGVSDLVLWQKASRMAELLDLYYKDPRTVSQSDEYKRLDRFFGALNWNEGMVRNYARSRPTPEAILERGRELLRGPKETEL